MINSEKRFNKQARKLIKHILENNDINSFSDDDCEIISACIEMGFLNAKYNFQTEDGKHHFELYQNYPVTAKGIKFIAPDHDWKFIISSSVALIELIVIIIQTVLYAVC